MYESGLPYMLDPHTLNTLGPENFNGALRLNQFAAHFRIDSLNQVFSYDLSIVQIGQCSVPKGGVVMTQHT